MDDLTNESAGTNDRARFLDSEGRPKTQALFYEVRYDIDALYTLKDYDFTVGDKVFPSARLLFLETNDPTEYTFATKYFLGWHHWQRICANKDIAKHVEKWREELEMKLRAEAVGQAMALARGGSYQAAKFMVDRGWAKRAAGRPSKEEVERETKFQARMVDEYSADVIRLAK